MSRKTSDIWYHFTTANNESAKCKYCSVSYSYKGGSTANLSRHLKRKHIIQYDVRKKICTDKTDNLDLEENIDDPDTVSVHQNISETQNQPSTSSFSTSKITHTSNKTSQSQTRMESFIPRPLSMNKSQKIDEQLGIMIAKEFQPFSVVENIEFRKFVHLLNPNYSIPSRKAVSKSILPQLLEKTKQKVKTNLNNAKYIAFTTDGWTSLNNDSFVAITVHYIDNIECVLKSYLLGCYYFEQAHTAINLSEFMIKCFDEWEISEKIKVAVSDNAANITSAISLNSNWRHMPCLAHGINLIAQSGLSEIQSVHKKVKSIVEFFKRSTKSYIKLKQTQTQMGQPLLKLIQDVATRWNSTYDMFQRCIDIKDPLISTIALIGKNENLTPDDFYIMEHYCSVFKPFKEMTIELSSEKGVSISKVIILCNVLLSHIKKKKNEPNLPSAIYSMLLTMETKAEKRFERIEEQRLLIEATILDPRFKKRGFSNTKSYEFAYQKIIQRVTTIIQSESEKHNLSGNEVNAVQENVNEKEKFDIWKDFDLQVWFLLYIILVSTSIALFVLK